MEEDGGVTVRTVDSKKHSTGRRVCITGLALALIFCVSAVFAGAEEIVVNFATWASADETAIWRRDIESFEKLHPDIKVNLITCSWNEYPDRVPLYLSGVIEVDILRNGGQHLPTFVQLGGLLPLTPLRSKRPARLEPVFPSSAGRDFAQRGFVRSAGPFLAVGDVLQCRVVQQAGFAHSL